MLHRLFNSKRKPQLHVYDGFGSESQLFVVGRVSKSSRPYQPKKEDSFIRNITSIVSTYLSKSLSGVTVQIVFDDKTYKTKTNQKGVFTQMIFSDVHQGKDSEWVSVEVLLPDSGISKKAEILIEGKENDFGIISDMDDTVLITNVQKRIKLLYLTLTKNAFTRKSFEGTKEFYRALTKGPTGNNTNPIFYISSSHWHLFNFLSHFLKLNDIPRGPLLLRSFDGISGLVKSIGDHNHKLESAKRVMDTFPNLPFILIGDSGQHDAYIYSQLVALYPNRIKVIYIRDVTTKEDAIVQDAIKTLNGKVELITIKTTEEAAHHAASKGYILQS